MENRRDREAAIYEAVLVALKSIGLETIRAKEFFGMNQKVNRDQKLAA